MVDVEGNSVESWMEGLRETSEHVKISDLEEYI
jgi:hypothetical protein